MQLKIKRSQKETMMGSVIFCIDARVEFKAAESEAIRRYKLGSQILYSNDRHSQLAQKLAAPTTLPQGGVATTVLGGAALAMLTPYKLLAAGALQSLNLDISVSGLEKGKHIECKSLEEVLGAEAALTDACENLRVFLLAAATFDGRETVTDFDAKPVNA